MVYEGADLAAAIRRTKKPTAAAAKSLADKASSEMVTRVRRNTPKDTGLLRESIREKKTISYLNQTGERVYESGAETDIEYAPYVEYGTGLYGPKRAKYPILPKKAGGFLSWITKRPVTLRSGKIVPAGTRIFVRKVMHPGSPPNYMFAIGTDLTGAEFDQWSKSTLDEWARNAEAAFMR